MIDWRNGLTWVPIIVFTLFLVISFVIGLAGGYKRALFWTGGNLILWLIAFIVTAAAGTAITNSIAQLIKDKVTAEQIQKLTVQEIADAIKIYVGLILYLVIALVGNLIIMLPLYFAGFVRWARIGKYDPHSKKYDALVAKYDTKKPLKAEKLRKRKHNLKMGSKAYFWLSRGVAIPASVVLAAPLTATMTQLAFGATVQTSKIYTADSKESSLKGLFDFTNWITSNIGKNYIGALGTNTSSIISGTNLALSKDANLQDVFSKITDCLNSVKEIGDDVSSETLNNDIKPNFTDFSNYVKNSFEQLESWIADLSLSNDVMGAVEAILNAVLPTRDEKDQIDAGQYENVRIFVNGVLTGGIINTLDKNTEPGKENEDILGTYPLDWYTLGSENYIQRLVVPTNVFNVIATVFQKILLTPDWIQKEPEATLDAAKSITSLFFECDDFQNGQLDYLDIIISPDQTIADLDDEGKILPNLPTMDDVADKLADAVIAKEQLTPKETVKPKLKPKLKEAIVPIFNFEQNTDTITQIKKNASGSEVSRENWGSESSPYIIPVDMFYTVDYNKIAENYTDYLNITVDNSTYNVEINTTGKQPFPCTSTDVIEFKEWKYEESKGEIAPLWWSLVPFFNPVYSIPDYKVQITPETQTGIADGTKEYLSKYLFTNWYESLYGDEMRNYCSLCTAVDDSIYGTNTALQDLSIMSKKAVDSPSTNTYKLKFEFFKDGQSIGVQYKYFRLSSFLKYTYTNPTSTQL